MILLGEERYCLEKNDIAGRRTILLGEKTYPFLSKCYMIGSYVILYFE
jgi:hypothetical protein